MKLGVRIPLGNKPSPFLDFHDLTYFVASRGHLENQTCQELTVVVKLTNFLWEVHLNIKTTSHTWHITWVLDLTYFSRSQVMGTSIYWGYFMFSSQEVSARPFHFHFTNNTRISRNICEYLDLKLNLKFSLATQQFWKWPYFMYFFTRYKHTKIV
jgi:hypothetical protein